MGVLVSGICDEVCVTTSRDVLIAMADGRGPRHAMVVALGYAGWTAGQLEQELLENAWLTVAAQRQLPVRHGAGGPLGRGSGPGPKWNSQTHRLLRPRLT